jgi:hypothetical protein
VIRYIVRSAIVLLGTVALVGGLVGQGRAAADGGGPTSAPAIRVAGGDFETYDHDDDGHRRYRCYDRYSYDGYGYDGYYRSYDDGYYRSYDDDGYDGRYRDRCRRYDDRYYDDRYDRHRGDHDGDRDFPDRRRGRNHDDD